MALQEITNKSGIIIGSMGVNTGRNDTTMDAVGESIAFIGRVFLEGGSGTKTISSSGGQIFIRFATTTFATAGTNIRIGIQDVGATGLEDGTFDVYADLVAGTDTITSGQIRKTAMETGTKDITHGDLIAVCVEMTVRNGVDSVLVSRGTTGPLANPIFPYATQDTGAGVTRTGGSPTTIIEFDDGTIGWFERYYLGFNLGNNPATVSFSSASATDEYAAVFKVPFSCSIRGAALNIGGIASTDVFEVILYSDPLGTPTVVETITPNANYIGSTGSGSLDCFWVNFTSYTLSPNTWYAVALRPTTGTVSFGYWDLGSGNEKMKKPSDFGSNIGVYGRANQSGAFTEVQAHHLPIFYLNITKLDDGVQTGGGGSNSAIFIA